MALLLVSLRPAPCSSGCGKTASMNLLSGFLAPQVGSVTINGQPVHPEMAALGYTAPGI
ncbi:ATP-binding cassette domain-containing protein [Niveispirillum sp. BGYR6]|uniref:ATP-binding cassette domain-containing protein n=1 Tax=Niveispirillum sp. BGYR6 TaxID=2971249 RepID=UPI00325F9B4C